MELPLLKDIILILGVSVGVIFLCNKIKVPAIVGYLLTGLLIGPHGTQLVKAVHEVEVLAEIGVILLLFTIGIEFSLRKLMKLKKIILIGGVAQLLFTTTVVTIVSYQFFALTTSIFIGFLFSLSSTAIVLKLLQEGGQIDSPHGKVALSILIFQDIIIVPIILITPFLADQSFQMTGELGWLLLKAVGIIAGVVLAAQWVVPKVLHQVARTRIRELFLISVITICFLVAWLTSLVGLSLALGAFLAGLIISESPYSQHALGNILPFKDLFLSFFFISIGMLLNIQFVIVNPLLVLGVTAGVLLGKTVLGSLATLLLRYPLRVSILSGLTICQVGEFSFILSSVGMECNLLSDAVYQTFLSVSIVTMGVTPFLLKLGPSFANIAMKPVPKRFLHKFPAPLVGYEEPVDQHLKDHLVIIGFGLNGRNLAHTARAADIPYIIIEMNPDTVEREQQQGEPIIYGDATYPQILEHAHMDQARVAVIAISDPDATRRIIGTVRALNPNVYLIVRTRFVAEVNSLYELGANEVIPEEFETSIEIFARVLSKYLIPQEDIEKIIQEIRSDSYEMLRSVKQSDDDIKDLSVTVPKINVTLCRVTEKAVLIGKSLGEVGLRNNYGVNLLAIKRGKEVETQLTGNTTIGEGDLLVVLGAPEAIQKLINDL